MIFHSDMDSSGPVTLRRAFYYNETLGWCVIPIPYRTKAARVRWGKYQTERPGEAQVKKWFGNGQLVNMAVVLGPVSGDLCCRDFDICEAYQQWAATHADLAEKLPTVRTAEGYHVYFQGDVDHVRCLGDGELRGLGGYCLLPPSTHPDGPIYDWITRPTRDNLLVIDPERAGFLIGAGDVTEKPEKPERTEEDGGERKRCGGGRGVEIDDRISAAIMRTLPTEFGTRHRKVFDFARELKSMPDYADADPKTFLPVVLREWHNRALPNINTKEFGETAVDFLKAWPKIKYGVGDGPMAKIFAKAVQGNPPKAIVEKYADSPRLLLLGSLCRELQREAAEAPFYLSTRAAGKLLGVSHAQANRWLFLLEAEGIIEVVAKGGMRDTVRSATRFRYLGD